MPQNTISTYLRCRPCKRPSGFFELGEDSVVQVEMHNSGRSSATEGATEGDLEAPCPPSANSNAATKLEQLSTRLSEAQRTVMH